MKLHHVQLAIPPNSEDACRQFYCSILGWEELPKPETLKDRGGLWLKAGEAELHLGVEENFTPAKKAHPAFLTDDINKISTLMKSHGIEFQWDDKLAAYKRLYVHDAVGNRLEFMELIKSN